MFKKLIFLLLCWRHRNTPYQEFLEEYTLVLKAARRCAYDLAHCADELGLNGVNAVDYTKRSEMWKSIFSPTGAKDYRHELHGEIFKLESKLDKALKLLDENGISHNINDIPF